MGIFIGWGQLIPQEILLQDLNLLKALVVLGLYLDWSDRSDPPVRTVGRARPTTYRSDWSLPILVVNICPLFFGKAYLPKNIILSQNCLRTMINITSAIFCAKGDKQLSAMSCFNQDNAETTCFDRHTYIMIIDIFGSASTCCSIASYLHIRCSLRF